MKLARRFVQVLAATALTASASLSGNGVGQSAAPMQDLQVSVPFHLHLPSHTVSWQQVFAFAGR